MPSSPAVPGLLHNALVIKDETITWVGPLTELPAEYADLPVEAHPGATLMPGMVATHDHGLAFVAGGGRGRLDHPDQTQSPCAP